MNEQERIKLLHRQRLEQCRQFFNLDYRLWDKYRLGKFELLPGNELAFKTALDFLPSTDNLQTPSEAWPDDEAKQDAWYDSRPDMHHFLTFRGNCGTGKTHLALGCGIWLIEKYEYNVIYWQTGELLSSLRNTYEDNNSGPSYRIIINRCKKADLLIFDDLGIEKRTDWASEVIDSLIDYRYVNRLQTIFTTNLRMSQLSPRIASRLKEGEVVLMDCGDYREAIAKKRVERREVSGEVDTILRGKNAK